MGLGSNRTRATRPPVDVIEERLAEVRADYLRLVPERKIWAQRSEQWGLKRRQIRRYLAVVKERVRRDRSGDAPDAVEADRAKAEALVLECIEDAADIKRRAMEQGDLKNELGAVKLRLDGATRWHDMRGLKHPTQIEMTKADPAARLTSDQRRERALRALKRMPSQVATGEGETH